MNLLTRIKLFYKSITPQHLSQSLGAVGRNYVKASIFRPQAQLRGITYKAIDKIGMSVSVYEPMVMRPNGDALQNHPFYTLFESPNKIQATSSDFVHLWAMLYEIYGETFWYTGARGEQTGKIKEIILLNPAQVELKIDDGELIGYILHKDNGTQVPLLPEEVIHDKRPNPFNPWRGMSIMERASTYIDTENITSTFTLSYMQNNASPSGILSLPDMEQNTFRQFVQQWREGYEGPENAGKTAFIRGGEASFKAVGATLKDVDQKVTREMAKDDVLSMFDVPKGLLGLSGEKGLGRNEIEPLEYIFAKYKIEPMMKRLDRIFTKILQSSSSRDATLYISHENVIPEDKEFIQKQNKELVNIAITVNEVRASIGLDPIDGGDVLQPQNTVPTTVSNSLKRVSLKKKITPEQAKINKQLEEEEFRKRQEQTDEIYIVKSKRVISKFASEQQKQVIGKINAADKAFEEWLFAIKEQSEELAAQLNPIMIALIEEQAKDVVNFITGNPFEITREMSDIVSSEILQISGLFNEDTYRQLERTLLEGQAKGESLMKLKKRVEEVYADAKGYRAERIARTETQRLSNMTSKEVYRQSGFSSLRWVTNPGACEFCQTFEGKVKELDATYSIVGDVIEGADGGQMSITYDDIQNPPLHPNCTCRLVPEK